MDKVFGRLVTDSGMGITRDWVSADEHDLKIATMQAEIDGLIDSRSHIVNENVKFKLDSVDMQVEIGKLRSTAYRVAAGIAKELHADECTEQQDRRLYALIQDLIPVIRQQTQEK